MLQGFAEGQKFIRGDRYGTAFLQRTPQNLQKRTFFSFLHICISLHGKMAFNLR